MLEISGFRGVLYKIGNTLPAKVVITQRGSCSVGEHTHSNTPISRDKCTSNNEVKQWESDEKWFSVQSVRNPPVLKNVPPTWNTRGKTFSMWHTDIKQIHYIYFLFHTCKPQNVYRIQKLMASCNVVFGPRGM